MFVQGLAVDTVYPDVAKVHCALIASFLRMHKDYAGSTRTGQNGSDSPHINSTLHMHSILSFHWLHRKGSTFILIFSVLCTVFQGQEHFFLHSISPICSNIPSTLGSSDLELGVASQTVWLNFKIVLH
jgi:hypothetical protein